MSNQVQIDCPACTGHGIGQWGAESRCTRCNGRGYFNIDTEDPEWIEYCADNDLDVKTGEDRDPTPCCYQHGCGALSTTEPCPKIADND